MKFRMCAPAGVAIVALLLSGCSAQPETTPADDGDTLKIGASLSLSGPLSALGLASRNALEVLVADLNTSGGVEGRQVELVFEDDKADPTTAVTEFRSLVAADVDVIFGPSTTSGTLAAGAIAATANIPICTSALSNALTDKNSAFYEYLWLPAVNDSLSVPAVLKRAVEQGAKKLAIVWSEDAQAEYSKKLFVENAATNGAQIVAEVSVASDATDLAPQATRVGAANPEAILLAIASPAQIAALVRNLRQGGVDAPIYTIIGGGSSPEVLKGAGGLLGDYQAAGIYSADAPTPNQKKLAELLLAAGKTPTYSTYDVLFASCLDAVVSAAAAGGGTSKEQIQAGFKSGITAKGYFPQEITFAADKHLGTDGGAVVWVRADGDKFVPADD